MNGFLYSIAFKFGNLTGLNKVIGLTQRLDDTVDKVHHSVGQARDEMGRFVKTGTNGISNLTNNFGTWLARLGLGITLLGSLQTAAQVEGIEQFVTFSSAEEGARNLEFLYKTIDDLGLSIAGTSQAYKIWTGGVQGLNFSADMQRGIFKSVAEAASVMRLSADDTTGVFLALSQMASKGTVSAEELRGQLGERLPGAFSIAARSIGVTESQLGKMLQKGEVMSKDFLPAFAKELNKTFGGAVQEAANSATANFNRFNNSILNLKNSIGQQLLPVAIPLIQNFLIPTIDFVGQNIEVLGMLATSFLAVRAAAWSYTTGQAIAALATKTFTGSIWGLNAAMLANPITWVVGLLVALTAGVVYAWNKFEGFRGFIYGMWEVIKVFGGIVNDFLIRPFVGLGQVLVGVFTGNIDLINKGMDNSLAAMNRVKEIGNLGQEIGMAYKSGFQKGVNNFNAGTGFLSRLGKKVPGAIDLAFGGGTGGTGGTNNDPFGGNGDGKNNVKNGISAITGGGKQTKNITINAQFGDTFVRSETLQEGMDEIQEMVMRMFTQVLNSANQAQLQ